MGTIISLQSKSPIKMGNWNSHPDQNVDRKPPMQFQDDEIAEEYYPEQAWMNDHAWMYILGMVIIMFLVISCCYCLCTMGENSPQPAKTNGYTAIASTAAPSAQLSSTDQMLYAGIPSKMPSMKAAKPSGIYPTFSQNASVRMYHQGPPNYSQMQTQPQMQPQQYSYGPGTMGQSFRAVPSEKEETK